MKQNEWTKLKVETGAKYLAYHELWLKMVDFDYYVAHGINKEAMKSLASINKMREKLGEPIILIPVN